MIGPLQPVADRDNERRRREEENTTNRERVMEYIRELNERLRQASAEDIAQFASPAT